MIFSKYIENDPREYCFEKLRGKRLIELGSGCGLAGLACMMRGAITTLTDLAVVVESLTSANAHVNDMTFTLLPSTSSKPFTLLLKKIYTHCMSNFSSVELHRPLVEALDWTAEYPTPEKAYDIVLLTDCVFSPHLAKPLVKQLLRLSGKKTEVICCHEIRDEVSFVF